jgi:hypothetical protein
MEVPEGTFSLTTKVARKYNMPGGGMERTASGNIKVKITEVYEP